LLIGSEIAVVYWAKVRITEAEEVNRLGDSESGRLDDRFEVGEVNRPSGQEGGIWENGARERGRFVPML
jgi:hypothetical protein